MKTMEELREYLVECGFEDSVLFEEPNYLSAIEGVSSEGNVIYNYDKMVQSLADEYLEADPNLDSESAEEMAIEWIEFNAIPTLPYMESVGIVPTIYYPIGD